MQLNNFFTPRSIAIVGASSDKNKVGYALVANLISEVSQNNLRGSISRSIYPVTISEKEVLGLKAYASLGEIEGEIDLVLIAVRADIVPSILEECAQKGAKTVIIISAGFKEMGLEGAELEKRVAEIALKNNITLLGPNCLGTIDTYAQLNASFASVMPKKGHIAFLSQSGALGTAVLDKALTEGIGFSKFISLGNEAVLSEIEFMEYLKDDKDTKAILMYVEQLSNGPEFMRLASEITKDKPIVLIKAGRGLRGQQAVMSHTGSLAPEDAVFSAACRQSGVIVVESIREFFNMAKLFELSIFKPLQKLIILTNAGGPAVVTADLVDFSRSLSLVELSDGTKEQLRKVLPSMAAVNNPVDIIGDALSIRYESALKILVEEKEADAIVTLVTPQMMTQDEATAKLLVDYNKRKPIIPVFIGGSSFDKGLAVLKEQGLINFSFPKDAIEALDNLARGTIKKESGRKGQSIGDDMIENGQHDDSRESSGETIGHNHRNKSPSEASHSTITSLPNQPMISLPKMMSFTEMRRLFSKYNLTISGILVKEKEELEEAMKKLDDEAVGKASAYNKTGSNKFILKVMSPDVIHKTDMGAVKLNLATVDEMTEAWDEMLAGVHSKNPEASIEGMLLQTMIPGKEIIVGMKRDPIFGPTILFGLGGIFTEALKDTSLRIAPVSKEIALEMIHEIRGINILTGLRGEKSVDLEKLASIIVNVSKLSIENPQIKEIDLNPVMMRVNDAEIVDARVMS